MKVQGINNQNNISHKAYFRENDVFKLLLKKNYRQYWVGDITFEAKKFKSMLPDHEIEILKVNKTSIFEGYGNFVAMNHVTKKVREFSLEGIGEPCLKFIMNVLRRNEKSADFFDETKSYEKALYNDLTTPGDTLENINRLRKKK